MAAKRPYYRRGEHNPFDVARIVEAAKMRARGFSWAAVSKKVGLTIDGLRFVLKKQAKLWNESLDAAMAQTVAEVRELAGTEKMLPVIDEYSIAAIAAEKWLRDRGEHLFPMPDSATTKADGAKHTLRSFFEAYYRPVRLFDGSPETTDLYIKCIRRFELLVGNPTLAEVTTEMLAHFRDMLLAARRYSTVKVLSAHTVRMYVRHIQYLLDCAGPPVHKSRDRAGFIDVVPYCKPPRAELPEPKIVKDDLLSACYEAAGSMETPRVAGVDPPAWWRALLVVAYNVGLRRRTLFAMEWRHVDFHEGTLRLPAAIMKSRKRLLLPMNDIVRRHLLAIRSDEEKVFPWPFSREWFGRYFRQLQATAGVMGNAKFGLHTLRKTCATTLFKEDAQAAQLMLGHAALSVTKDSYVNAVAALRDSVSRMPQPSGFVTSDVRPSVVVRAENDAALDWL